MREASPGAAVDQLCTVTVRPSELHARRAHARERVLHSLVDIVHRLQECAEVPTSCADHSVVPLVGDVFFDQ